MKPNFRGRLLRNDNITELSQCEIFVFGSNLEGHHMGGAARTAYEHFGAEWGNGVGPQGQCYAIPTMFSSIKQIKPYVDDFIEYVKSHPRNRFLITKVGCGIAGFKSNDMAELFGELFNVNNAIMSVDWMTWLMLNHKLSRDTSEDPEVIDERVLIDLCNKYKYEIGSNLRIDCYVPSHIRVRYAIDNGKFGYKSFGDFFFYGQEMYVFDKDKKWKDDNIRAIVLDNFNDECPGHGYAHKVIFAGVRTPFTDKHGNYIYTGDIVKANFHGSPYTLPVAAMPGRYALMLDNHCIPLSECEDIIRLGTVFYKLQHEDTWQQPRVNGRCMNFFQSVYGTFGCPPNSTLGKELTKAQLTPCFYTEDWEYLALKEAGIEFDWK